MTAADEGNLLPQTLVVTGCIQKIDFLEDSVASSFWRGKRVCLPVALGTTGFFVMSALVAKADSLFLGFNTLTPIQVYSESGSYKQDLGPAGAIAAVIGPSSYYFIQPSSSSNASTITQYSPSLVPGASFSVSDLIDDGAPGTAGTLWLAGFNGAVFQVSTTGAVLESWSTGFTHIGIATDGTYVYTTEGDSGSNIDKWSTAGAHVGDIATPLTGLYGLGRDAKTGDFWAGSTSYVYGLNPSGNLLSSLYIPGDSRTPNGAVHDGMEVGNLLPPAVVPEPCSTMLIGLGAFALLAMASRQFKLRQILSWCSRFA